MTVPGRLRTQQGNLPMSTREAASSGGEGGSRPGSVPRAHPAVRDCLERVRHRWQVLRLVEGTGRVLGALGVAIVVLFAADNVFHLSPALRGTLLGIALLLVLAEALRSLILRPLHVLGDEECALLVERGERAWRTG